LIVLRPPAGVVLVIIVAGGAAWIMFAVLARKGLLRVDQVTELAGIDNMDHGEQQQRLQEQKQQHHSNMLQQHMAACG
jgi:ammonia channel protein AmtB